MLGAPESRSQAALFCLLGHESEAVQARFGPGGFSRHFHDTFSFGLVLRGMNRFGYRRRTFEAEQGSIGICDPGEVHDGGMAGIPWAYRAAFPSAPAMTAIAAELGMNGMPEFGSGHITDPLSIRRLNQFLTLLFAQHASSDAAEEAGIDAFSTIISRNAEGVRPAHRTPVCETIAAKALAAIHEGWHEPLTLAQIAKHAGATRFATIRSVARATGLTPHAYLTQLRVREAKRLMRQGMSIAHAAVECGFVDQSHLSRALTRRWGASPGAFKLAYARATFPRKR